MGWNWGSMGGSDRLVVAQRWDRPRKSRIDPINASVVAGGVQILDPSSSGRHRRARGAHSDV